MLSVYFGCVGRLHARRRSRYTEETFEQICRELRATPTLEDTEGEIEPFQVSRAEKPVSGRSGLH
ncbi:unnamed protein product [Fusarium graminearum]|nr:unnamed protein product [Fusarium graminearum]